MKEYFYYSDPELPNRVSVCGLYEDGRLRFSAARCSDSDRFIRKVGRDKARGRAISHPITTVSAVPEEATTKIFLDHAKRLAEAIRQNPNFTKESLENVKERND